MQRLLIILLFLAGSTLADEPIDYVNLGSTLLRDGYTQRASTVLDKADVSKKDFDFARYYSLKGILLHRQGYPTLSNIFFDASFERGQNNPAIFLYVAKNYWQIQDYPQVIAALERAGEAAKQDEQMFVIKAEAYKQQGDFNAAWAALDEGISLFPAYSRFYSQKFYYLLELGFFQHALEYADQYLQSKDYRPKDYLAVAYALRENGQYGPAAELLEEAVLRYDSDEKLIELLSQVYIDQEKYLMAALVLDWAAIRYPEFAHKAATLYLKGNEPVRSLQLNRRIPDQQEKFRQRLGIDIYTEDYESLVAKLPALKRYGLMEDDHIKYAVGYAYFVNGDYTNAKRYLQSITDAQLFRKASHIFQHIETCQNELFTCY